MHGDSAYNLMFGPDICGYSTKKVHVIFRYKGENHLIKKDIKCKDDELAHIYTLIVSPDNTYKVCSMKTLHYEQNIFMNNKGGDRKMRFLINCSLAHLAMAKNVWLYVWISRSLYHLQNNF